MTHATTLFGPATGAQVVPLWAVLGAGCTISAVLIWAWTRDWSVRSRRTIRFVNTAGLLCAGAAGLVPSAAAWLVCAALALGGLSAVLAVARASRNAHPLQQPALPNRLRVLDAALNASRDGILVTVTSADTIGLRIVYANPAFEELTGYGTEEVAGQSPSLLYKEDAADDRDFAHAALSGGAPARFEVPARRKDGRRVWVEWSAVPVPGTIAGDSYQIAVLRDITERKRLEDQLRQAAKMEAVGQLAAGVAHDFNNLLTVIGGNAAMLADAVAHVPEATPLVEQLRFAADRAGGLVRQLLIFSRRREPKRETVDLVRVVTDVSGILGRLIGTAIKTEVTVPNTPVFIDVDRGQLEQAIINLAVNARDAMPVGGRLRIAVEGAGSRAVLKVIDTGCGMPDAVKARIFEPFFTTKGPEKGTGLGLAMVFEFVQRHGGAIAVDSAPGVGTAFQLTLPLCSAPSPARPTAVGSAAPRVARGSVLVVEDEPGVRALARAILEGRGYTVTAVGDGTAAIAELESGSRFDVVVTDMIMPGPGGDHVAATARRLSPAVGVVFMSGYTESEPSVPGSVYIQKPFSPTALLEAVYETGARRAAVAAPILSSA